MIESVLQFGFGGAALLLLHQFKLEVRKGFASVGARLDAQDARIAAVERPLGFQLTQGGPL